jgi:hypothetical protein
MSYYYRSFPLPLKGPTYAAHPEKICYNTNYILFNEGRNYVEMHSVRLRV